MKHLIKHFVMVAVIVALAAGAYMAYQRYSASKSEVKIQLFDGWGHNNGSYDQGYRDGMRDCNSN